VLKGWFGTKKQKISMTLDGMFGTSFDHHVIAGYRFLMRYYTEGDFIYIFGFSRGAFTARFLASMIGHVGLLSRGNEEMVSFAFKNYSDYELDKLGANGLDFLNSFKETFSRDEANIHFLGLWDTVCSVSTINLPGKTAKHLPMRDNLAVHVRHAVSVDEKRVMFHPALLGKVNLQPGEDDPCETRKEIWFPGDHGDTGGGWPPKDMSEKNPTQITDLSLEWMLREVTALPDTGRFGSKIALTKEAFDFLDKMDQGRREKAIRATVHDNLVFGGGNTKGKVIYWNIIGKHSTLGVVDLKP
jgi:uncharacterized protein (DUF2235 family)